MKAEIIIAGFGGQGVLSMGKILAYSGLIIEDIYATERSYQKFVIWRNSKARHYFVLDRMVPIVSSSIF